mgnify:CR=1 FL=1
MHVRVARFEGVDTQRIDEDYERFKEMLRSQEPLEGMPEDVARTLKTDVRRVLSLADRETGVTLDLTFADDAEAARRVDEALDSLSPPDGSGRRTSVQIYELMVDEQL